MGGFRDRSGRRRDDGAVTAIVNTGCWLRQLQQVPGRLGAPGVFVPAYVQTHVRVRHSDDGLMVELWGHPTAASRSLSWTERVAIAGRLPERPAEPNVPRLVDRQLVGAPTRPLPT